MSADPELWNRAADLAINPILIANGLKLPSDALIDPGFNNLSAEEIYARLARPTSGTSSSNSSQAQPQSGPGAATGGSQQRNDGSGLGSVGRRVEQAVMEPSDAFAAKLGTRLGVDIFDDLRNADPDYRAAICIGMETTALASMPMLSRRWNNL